MPDAFAEGRITQLRREAKLALGPAEARQLRARLTAELGAPAVSRIVSVYFDGPGWPLAARAADLQQDALKLRSKEYFPDRGDCGNGRVVLEVKREANGITRKDRLWVSRDRLQPALQDLAAPALRDTLGDFPIFPAVAVSYEREVYQGEETWRVTIDTGVEFFRVEPRLALSSAPLRRELLGEPAGREERTIVEVKYLDGPVKHLDGPVPAWALSSGGARRYSKFAEAMRQVHGVGETRAAVG